MTLGKLPVRAHEPRPRHGVRQLPARERGADDASPPAALRLACGAMVAAQSGFSLALTAARHHIAAHARRRHRDSDASRRKRVRAGGAFQQLWPAHKARTGGRSFAHAAPACAGSATPVRRRRCPRVKTRQAARTDQCDRCTFALALGVHLVAGSRSASYSITASCRWRVAFLGGVADPAVPGRRRPVLFRLLSMSSVGLE